MALRGEQYRRYVLAVQAPAPGAELVITPNAQGAWRVQDLLFALTTSVAAPTRQVQLSATDGTTEWWRTPVAHRAATSSAQVFCAHAGASDAQVADQHAAKQASAVFAAAAGGTASLAPGDSIVGFDLCLQSIAAAQSADVTLTNVRGGTITYRIPIPIAGTIYSIRFEDPLPALTGLVAPTLTLPAAVGGPAGSIVLYGLAATSDTVTTIALPDEGIWLEQGWSLRTRTLNLDVADQYSAIAAVIEEVPSGPDWTGEPIQPTQTFPLDS